MRKIGNEYENENENTKKDHRLDRTMANLNDY